MEKQIQQLIEWHKKFEVTKFETAYDAGFDAGKNGANTFNSHFKWFRTKESMQEWERGKRNAEIK